MFYPTSIVDLIDALKDIQLTASEVQAWRDNDDEPSLNSFANSGVGGRRSDALLDAISTVSNIASKSLTFTQDGTGRLHRRDRNQLERAGFTVLADQPDYMAVAIPPTGEAYRAAEKAGTSTPETMTLELLHQYDDEE
jgi:hypothetical protein